MNAAVATALAFAGYALGYIFYSRYLAQRVFELDDANKTPAHTMTDGVDYVPTSSPVLFGHHYASIAGLAPMLGPAVAVIWGWVPAMAWVVFGALFVGCVHDFGSLVVSIRARGKSIGVVAEGLIGERAKTLLHIVIFFLVALAMGVFIWVIAKLFAPNLEAMHAAGSGLLDEPVAERGFPQAILPSFGLMVIASLLGWLGYRRGVSWKVMTPVGFALFLGLIYVAQLDPVFMGVAETLDGWNDAILQSWFGLEPTAKLRGETMVDWLSAVLLVYALVASVLPVWVLLQPRDFLNVMLLFLGLGGLYLGVFVGAPEFAAPAVNPSPEGAPSMFPFVFIVIACGAASGFHSLVSSGTTAKQLDRETDARPIGYGGMIGESLLGLIAVLATTAGFSESSAWSHAYGSWSKVQALGTKVANFINGAASFLESLGIGGQLGASFVSVIVVSYALTSLDSATRLLRYNLEEVGETLGIGILGNRYISGTLAAVAIGFFAFFEIDGTPAGLALWTLFGTTNQLLAGLALLVVTLYLLLRGKQWWWAGIPMAAMLVTTLLAMAFNVGDFYRDASTLPVPSSVSGGELHALFAALLSGNWLLLGVGSLLLVLGIWLVIEATIAIVRFRMTGETIESMFIDVGDDPPSS